MGAVPGVSLVRNIHSIPGILGACNHSSSNTGEGAACQTKGMVNARCVEKEGITGRFVLHPPWQKLHRLQFPYDTRVARLLGVRSVGFQGAM